MNVRSKVSIVLLFMVLASSLAVHVSASAEEKPKAQSVALTAAYCITLSNYLVHDCETKKQDCLANGGTWESCEPENSQCRTDAHDEFLFCQEQTGGTEPDPNCLPQYGCTNGHVKAPMRPSRRLAKQLIAVNFSNNGTGSYLRDKDGPSLILSNR